MILWLASYPRSGNTLLRTILSQCFAASTFSLYDDGYDIGAQAEFRSAVGHINHGLTEHKFYKRAQRSEDVYFVKTHDAPRDSAKAIYVLRDGRSAIVSYWHYLSTFIPRLAAPILLKQVIVGKCPFGSWSDHLWTWDPINRPNTLILRYETLALDPLAVLENIAGFIDRPVLQRAVPAFADLQRVNPRFFRTGNDTANIAEIQGDNLDLFWRKHGRAMREFGFDSGSSPKNTALVPSPGESRIR